MKHICNTYFIIIIYIICSLLIFMLYQGYSKHSKHEMLLCLEKPYSEQSIRKVETIALK